MLEELRFFLVILEEGSLRRAAKRLHISQPALTRQMQLHEHDLGGRILEPTSAGAHPTNEGHALAEQDWQSALLCRASLKSKTQSALRVDL